LNADALILPSGAFIEAMINLRKFGLDVAIQESKYGAPILESVLDYSYFTESEGGAGKGLDLFRVIKGSLKIGRKKYKGAT
jgi:imidazoleglycerol phosphate synthase glutamine amidotransferase subunit HisH